MFTLSNLAPAIGDCRLILVGTVHADPSGFRRTFTFLHALRPDLVLVELSPYGLAFRIKNQRLTHNTLNTNLRIAAESVGVPYRQALRHPEITAIKRQVSLPFEYRAARTYARKTSTPLFLVDYSPFSRRFISQWPEMISIGNLRTLLSLPGDFRSSVSTQYNLAYRSLQSKCDSLELELARYRFAKEEDIHEKREVFIARLIRRVLEREHPRLPVYLGGWEHLMETYKSMRLRNLLKVDSCDCYLLDRGFLQDGRGSSAP